MASSEELLARLVTLAEEQLRWQRASVLPGVRATVAQALTTTQLRTAFEACDGKRTSRDIAQSVGASPQAFSSWTRRWRDLGIAFETPARTIQHLTTLKSLGVPVEVPDAQ